MANVLANKKNFLLYLLVGTFVLIVACLVVFTRSRKVFRDSTTSGNTETMLTNSLVVTDYSEGGVVVFREAVLQNAGFVLVKKIVGEKEITLGVSNLLTAGEYIDLEVDLTENVSAGYRLNGRLVRDDGDGLYDSEKDSAVIQDGGEEYAFGFTIGMARDFDTPPADEVGY